MKKIIVAIFFFQILVACSPSKPDEPETEMAPTEQTTYERDQQANNSDIANHLAEIALNVPHVVDAETLVLGPYVTVAIDIDEDIDDARVATVKYTVSEALQNDKYGKTAIVIAEANMTERFRDMQNKIQDGQPIQAVMDELAEIVNRYMPTFPVEEAPSTKNNLPNQTKENEDINKEQNE